MGDIFQEVDEDIRRERAHSIWNKYKVYIISILVLILFGVGFNSIWSHYKLKSIQERSEKYFSTLDIVNDNPQEGIKVLKLFSENEKDSNAFISMISMFSEATIRKNEAEVEEALKIYSLIIQENYDQIYTDYSKVLSAEILMELDRLVEAKNILNEIADTLSVFTNISKEYLGYIAIREGRLKEATDIFQSLIADASVSDNIKDRVGEILRTLEQ